MIRVCLLLLALLSLSCAASRASPAGTSAEQQLTVADFRADARAIEKLIEDNYAYLDRFPKSRLPVSEKLRAERERVDDKRSLLRFAERMLLTLADHHAITGSSTAESWAVVPSYADIWVERRGEAYMVDAVREASPAQNAGIRAGDRLVSIGGAPMDDAVKAFWSDLGLPVTQERADFAARVLAAGRRNRPRELGIARGDERPRQVSLSNLYAAAAGGRPVLEARQVGKDLVIRINDSLGEEATIAAFDAAMASAKPKQRVILDLTNTPSGGNTVVARAIMGWFVERPRFYQIHNLPAEKRRTGIERQWVEQVLPREGKHHQGHVVVKVGRWTGSMGEGLAIGFDALGAEVVGTRMARLLGAVYDYKLENSGLVIKLPTERLLAVDGTPREAFAPTRRGITR